MTVAQGIPLRPGRRRPNEDTCDCEFPCGDEVQVAATPILEVAGMVAYHTSIILGSREYYFDIDGITAAPALWSHVAGPGACGIDFAGNTEVVTAGRSVLGEAALLQHLGNFFLQGSYDVLLKNCNSFTDSALYLLTRTRLNSRYTRLERFIAGTRPVSTMIIAAMLRNSMSPGEMQTIGLPQEYEPNPSCAGFSIENIIKHCDALDSEPGWSAVCNMGSRASRKASGRLPLAAGGKWCNAIVCCETLGSCMRTRCHQAFFPSSEGLDYGWVRQAEDHEELTALHVLTPGLMGGGRASEAVTPSCSVASTESLQGRLQGRRKAPVAIGHRALLV